jgi:ABC-type sugar transport system substrate-binding protein
MYGLINRGQGVPRWLFVFGVAACFVFNPAQAQERPPRIGLLCSDTMDDPFWKTLVTAARTAAEDLGAEIHVSCGKNNTYTTKRAGNKLLRREPKLDYLLTGFWLGVTHRHLQIARDRDIEVIVFNADLDPDSRRDVGGPREKYENWIGHLVPDDTRAGTILARELISRAKAGAPDGEVQVIGLSGNDDNRVSADRNMGLKGQIELSDQATLNELVFAYWTRDAARRSTRKLLEQYPDTSVVWAASDRMALGAVDAAKQLGRTPGEDLYVGGFDWTRQGLQAIADGDMAASVGGHFLEGVWAVVMAYDHYYGFDFADGVGVRALTPMHLVTASNLERYRRWLEAPEWAAFDFRSLSKKYNSEIDRYRFDIEQFVDSSL